MFQKRVKTCVGAIVYVSGAVQHAEQRQEPKSDIEHNVTDFGSSKNLLRTGTATLTSNEFVASLVCKPPVCNVGKVDKKLSGVP